MATCSVSELMADGSCYQGLGPLVQVLELVLLCRINQNLDPMASCDVTTLMAEASDNCFIGLTDKQVELLQLQILCDIYNQVGGGGSNLGSVENYVALRAYAIHNDNDIINVLGAVVAGDAGGGWFWYDAASTAADDGVNVFLPDDVLVAEPGRWIRQ